jgi:ribosomal protein L29
MKVKEMRELSKEELVNRVDETRKGLVEMRFQLALRKLENPAKLRTTRKELAQMLTILTEKESTEATK